MTGKVVVISLKFIGYNEYLESVVLVKPLEEMPNQFSGLIIGQYGAIALLSLQYKGHFFALDPAKLNLISYYDGVDEEQIDFTETQ